MYVGWLGKWGSRRSENPPLETMNRNRLSRHVVPNLSLWKSGASPLDSLRAGIVELQWAPRPVAALSRYDSPLPRLHVH